MAVENLLGERSPAGIYPAEITRALEPHRVRGAAARSVLRAVYVRAVEHFLQDEHLQEAELSYLSNLRSAFRLSEDEILDIERATLHPRFRRRLAEMLSDGQIDEAERAELENLHTRLTISPAIREQLTREVAGEAVDRMVSDAAADRRLSPEEWERLEALGRVVGFQLTPDTATKALLDRFALFWRIENKGPPAVPVDISLQRGEECYYQARAEHHEIRSRIRRVAYGGPVARVRIMKGLYYRVGVIDPVIVRDENLVRVNEGALYITNKRLIFRGTNKSTSIRLGKILAFSVASDGIVVERDTGKHPHFIISGDVELAAVVLGAVLARA